MILLKAIKNTYQVKDVLRQNGFKWNGEDECWEGLFDGRREYYSFMCSFLDGSDERDKVVFKAYDVDTEDLKHESQKEFEKLKETLMKVEEVKSVEEVKDEKRIGLKVVAVKEKTFWYDEVNVDKLQSEIESYKIILKGLVRNHDNFVKLNNIKKLQEEKWIELFCIPLYEFLVDRKKRLKKRHRKYYEDEVEVIEKHVPDKRYPVDNNRISSLESISRLIPSLNSELKQDS